MKLVTLFVVLCSTLAISNGQIIWDKLTAEELSALAPSSFRQIKPLELASIPDSACSGYKSEHMAVIPPSSYIGFFSKCVAVMPPDAWRNVSAEQIVNVAGKAFTAFTPAQVIAMNKNAFRSITNIQSANFQTETLLSISTEKFKEVSPLFTNGLSAAQWLSLIEFRTNVTTIFDISQMSSPNLEVASNVADFYDSGRLPISGTFPLDPSQLTWLEVASLHAPKPENIPTVIMAIHQAVAGFRRMVISSMTPEDMATFVPPQGRYFTAGILSTITEIQFGNIGQDVVKEFTEHAWPGLNASLIPMLSRGVVESFSNDVIMTLTCSQLGNFTAQQYSWLPDTKRPLFEAVRLPMYERCFGVQLPPAASDSPPTTPTPTNPKDSDTGLIVGITIGSIAIVALSGLASYLFVAWRQKRAEQKLDESKSLLYA